MLIVVLTGGIGSGKSTVVDLFKSYGVPVIDTDIIARELLTTDTAQKAQTIAAFGADIVTANGDIDREQLRKRVFTSDSDRLSLQSILHPEIRRQSLAQLHTLQSAYCLLVIPLLYESGQQYPRDRVLLVESSEALQIERASRRDHCPPELIRKIIDSQATAAQRRSIADDIITNNGDLELLRRQVDEHHTLYLQLAKQKQVH